MQKHRYKNEDMNVPIYTWLQSEEYTNDEKLVNETENLSKLSFVEHHVALMADGHPTGGSIPVGGVIACNDVIMPHAVGGDIGCGVHFMKFNIKVEDLKGIETGSGSLLHKMAHDFLRETPVGYRKHSEPRYSTVIEDFIEENSFDGMFSEIPKVIVDDLENAKKQIGTLGSGNHFCELQEDKDGYLCAMIHSGSRHFGHVIAQYYQDKAEEMCNKWYSDTEVPFLPADSKLGKEYIKMMNVALDYARENREHMAQVIYDSVFNNIEDYTDINIGLTKEPFNFEDTILEKYDVHHNYATIENHKGKNLWVHRKGATLAREGTIGLIPGSMGTNSYVVKGKGNDDSFHSCSHGAGRRMSRTKAFKEFNTQDMVEDLKEKDIILASPSDTPDLVDEYKKAYKNIKTVIEQQDDLIEVKNKLKPIAVVKG